MTEQELINKLQFLKQVRPRQEWVVLSKNNILKNSPITQPVEAEFTSAPANIFNTIFTRKSAYTFAVLLMATLGVVGFMHYGALNVGVNTQNLAAVSQVELSPEVKSNLEKFQTNSKDLALVAKTNPQNISVIADQVKLAAQALTDAIKKDPKVAKEIALAVNNSRTYLANDEDVKETNDSLIKMLDEQLFEDFNSITLTDEQAEQIKAAKDIFDKGDYPGALVNFLLLSHSIDKK